MSPSQQETNASADVSGTSGSPTRGILLLVLVLAVSAVLGGLYGPAASATASSSDDTQDSVKTFTRVLSVVERNYADPVDTDKAIYDGAIPGMLHVLDPHSNFFDPKQYALFREEQEGKYYGVGMVVAQRDNQTVVQYPFRKFASLQGGDSSRRYDREGGRKTLHRADDHRSGGHAQGRQGDTGAHRAGARGLGQARSKSPWCATKFRGRAWNSPRW